MKAPKPKHPIPDLQKHIDTEPGLVDRIFDYILASPGLAEAIARVEGEMGRPIPVEQMKLEVEMYFAGQRDYITPRHRIASQVLALFNGRNATEVARQLHIGRATVYRILKQPGMARRK